MTAIFTASQHIMPDISAQKCSVMVKSTMQKHQILVNTGQVFTEVERTASYV